PARMAAARRRTDESDRSTGPALELDTLSIASNFDNGRTASGSRPSPTTASVGRVTTPPEAMPGIGMLAPDEEPLPPRMSTSFIHDESFDSVIALMVFFQASTIHSKVALKA